jgi:hypothetical protein
MAAGLAHFGRARDTWPGRRHIRQVARATENRSGLQAAVLVQLATMVRTVVFMGAPNTLRIHPCGNRSQIHTRRCARPARNVIA